MSVPIGSREKKGTSVSQKEFLFGAMKPLFFGMHRFHFLSEVSGETVTFAFIYLIFYFIDFLKFIIQSLQIQLVILVGWVLWQINPYRLSNANSYLSIYIYIYFPKKL